MNMEDGLQFNLPKNRSSVIKVIGVGGGGSNAVNYMANIGVNGVDFVVCNTDAQALEHSPVHNKVQLGASLTEGLGAGADPEIGRRAAEESIATLQSILETGTKMCFITAGMGGGTGTGAAPVIAKTSRDMGILTVGIVTAPFSFEGNMRKEQAVQGIREMREAVDSLIVINNDKLRQVYGDLGFRNAFAKADEVLAGAAKGIAEVITNHYTANIDLRDAKTVLENSGSALFGTGKGEGANRAAQAVQDALDSPLLNDNHIKGAKNVLLLVTSGADEHEVTIDEIGEITDHIQREAGGNTNIIMGIGSTEEEGTKITCTIIATGFPTGTRVLPSDKPEMVIHELKDEDSKHTDIVPEEPKKIIMNLEDDMEEPVANFAPSAPAIETAPETEATAEEAPVAELPGEEMQPEHTDAPTVVFDLEDEAEETFEVETTFEVKETFETEEAFESETAFEAEEASYETGEESTFSMDEMDEAVEMELAPEEEEELPAMLQSEEDSLGFPKMAAQEDIEAAMETSLNNEEATEAQVHVLEWDEDDLEEDADFAAEFENEAPAAMELEAEADEAPAFEAAPEMELNTFEEEAPVAEFETSPEVADSDAQEDPMASWDLFSAPVEPASEEMTLNFVDEDDSEEEFFEAPAALTSEENHGILTPKTEAMAMPEELDAPLENKIDMGDAYASDDSDAHTFSLDDIEGDGFSLDIQEDAGMPLSSLNEDITEVAHDPFEMSLSEMPDLKSKSDAQAVEQSFTLGNPEFEVDQPSAEVDTMEADVDPDLHLEMKVAVKEELAPAEAPEKDFDMDRPLAEMPRRALNDMPPKMQERMDRLRNFQYQFKANQQNMADAERIPAYMRQGMDVDTNHRSGEQPSNLGVDNEGNIRTNNSFLHDNVD